jgi:hypothetical protein
MILHHVVLNIKGKKVNNNSQAKSLLHREGRLVDPNLVIFREILIEAVIYYPSGIFIQK